METQFWTPASTHPCSYLVLYTDSWFTPKPTVTNNRLYKVFLLYPCSAHKHPHSHWNVCWVQNKESNKGLCLINYIHNDRFDGGLQVMEDWSGLPGQWFEQLGKKTAWDMYDPPLSKDPRWKISWMYLPHPPYLMWVWTTTKHRAIDIPKFELHLLSNNLSDGDLKL